MIEAWLPTIVAAGALGLVWFGIRSQRKELKNDVDSIKETFLMKESHTLLCENASLKINEHLTQELTGLKDSIFRKLRDIENTIKDSSKDKEDSSE